MNIVKYPVLNGSRVMSMWRSGKRWGVNDPSGFLTLLEKRPSWRSLVNWRGGGVYHSFKFTDSLGEASFLAIASEL
ncbi:hypothetical protein AVEN_183678-1, partial [Araneus ventricosus]